MTTTQDLDPVYDTVMNRLALTASAPSEADVDEVVSELRAIATLPSLYHLARHRALVDVLDDASGYDLVLTTHDDTGRITSVVARDTDAIPSLVLRSLDNSDVVYFLCKHRQSTSALVFWPTQHRLRQLGIADALAYVQDVLSGAPDDTLLLGYASVKDMVAALVEMVGNDADLGHARRHNRGRVVNHCNSLKLTDVWLARTHEAEPLCASVLQILLDLDHVSLLQQCLDLSAENEDHPKMHLVGPKVHACLARYGWATLAPAVDMLLARWGATSPANTVHIPFALLASLAGVADEPICPPLEHQPNARGQIAAAYGTLRAACKVSTVISMCPEYPNNNAATDAAMQLLKNCLLLEAYLTPNANVQGTLPAPILACIPRNDDSFPSMFVLSPAIAFAVAKNPRVSLGSWTVRDVAHRVHGCYDIFKSPVAAAGNLLLRLQLDDGGATLCGEMDTMLDATDDDMKFGIVSGIIALAARHTIPARLIEYLARVVATATTCLLTTASALDIVVPYFFQGPVPVDKEERELETRRYIMAGALGFFNEVAPHCGDYILTQLDTVLENAEGTALPIERAVRVLLPLLEEFTQRWPKLAVDLRDEMLAALQARLQVESARSSWASEPAKGELPRATTGQAPTHLMML
ncbi:hypothetical protein SDRG_04514 [Saprolegnia diclina VS20]|uniref:Uncharacterized protein n=1 Tax=Saprolegnia diclina (strain VS20) TaxID=1156394 RepID=T0QJ97_SAPDV|nr:hypothetical protein SDRG_04514 [Saprolegnia diclina VS20]EQC38084.1 hypothetical protein SDRG_04514 [Saprolegnia diclina VS20]|eukprot:XP_008608411.1 hypothetical protein SDRG_04514 [Saprolegnia diclina VS20]